MKKIKKALRHLFVPGHHNNHHPASLSHTALTAYFVLAFVSFVVLRNVSLETGNVLGFATDISPSRIVELTNDQRQSVGLGTLTYNESLAAAAAAKAKDMMSKGYWAHFGPDGETPWGFILSSGYQYEYAGENLAKNFMDSGAVVDAWMRSESHRANIMNGNYKEIGVAIVNGSLSGEDTTLVVQMFGSKSKIAGVTAQEVSTPVAQTTMIPVRARTLPTQGDAPNLQATNPTLTPAFTEQIVLTPSATEEYSPYLNLFPAFRLISAIAICFLIIIFAIDLYHISRTQFHKHRGKHVAHIIFLLAVLVGIYFLGRGAIL
ncbi:CAP domain-containing protein [Candidatus Woesebacteria bacterium]|nr:CAP domain-containing protein [Candidatus Woesebacteria bacterium]